jgi:hypothetical protein
LLLSRSEQAIAAASGLRAVIDTANPPLLGH